MNTKHAVTLVATLAISMATSAFAASDTWDMSKAKPASSDGKIRIPSTGQRTLVLDDPGVSIVEDAGAPTGKALAFSGSQTKPVIPGGGPYAASDSVSLKMNIKPEGGTTSEGTVLSHPGAYELRMSTGSREIRFYVNGKDKTPAVMARATITPNVWNTVEARVKGSDITLTVNGQTTSTVIPNAGTMNSASAFFRLGSMEGTRPYKGLLADLTVTEPAE